jgi:hypothetical protein
MLDDVFSILQTSTLFAILYVVAFHCLLLSTRILGYVSSVSCGKSNGIGFCNNEDGCKVVLYNAVGNMGVHKMWALTLLKYEY